MNRNTRTFFAAFAMALILILALCGFVAVDLSTDRYMPDKFGPFFEINSVKSDSVEFSFQAGEYILDTSIVAKAEEQFKKLSGLIPALPRLCASLAEATTELGTQKLKQAMSDSSSN